MVFSSVPVPFSLFENCLSYRTFSVSAPFYFSHYNPFVPIRFGLSLLTNAFSFFRPAFLKSRIWIRMAKKLTRWEMKYWLRCIASFLFLLSFFFSGHPWQRIKFISSFLFSSNSSVFFFFSIFRGGLSPFLFISCPSGVSSFCSTF